MPKLLQINSTANWGSTGRIAEQIGESAMASGWESYIAYGRRATPSKSQLIKIGSLVSILWHVLMSRLFDKHGLASCVATKRLIRQIKAIKPDVIHLHNIHGYYLNYRLLFEYLRTIDTPIVWTMHDCWAFTGHCAHYVKMDESCEQWRNGCFDCPYRKSYPKSIISKVARNYNLKKEAFLSLGNRLTVVPVSKWLESETKNSLFKASDVRYIYNGVDTTVFTPLDATTIVSKYKLNQRFTIIGVASTWCEEKGFSEFVKLRERLSDKYVIILVGVSKSQMKSLPQGVIGILRTQSQQELAELYSAADVVLSLSKAETFGLTIAEGMACGTPAIVYNRTAPPELITNNTGLVVDRVGNIDDVIEAIRKIEKNGKKYYSDSCRRYAVAHFDKKKSVQSYLQLYEDVMQCHK